MDEPMLSNRKAGFVSRDRMRKTTAITGRFPLAFRVRAEFSLGLHDPCRIRRVNDIVSVAMEDDGWRAPVANGPRPA